MKTIKLNRGERVIAVVPEYCAGPGWSNQILNVYIDSNGKLRTECLQPSEMERDQVLMFATLATAHATMLSTLKIKRTK